MSRSHHSCWCFVCVWCVLCHSIHFISFGIFSFHLIFRKLRDEQIRQLYQADVKLTSHQICIKSQTNQNERQAIVNSSSITMANIILIMIGFLYIFFSHNVASLKNTVLNNRIRRENRICNHGYFGTNLLDRWDSDCSAHCVGQLVDCA